MFLVERSELHAREHVERNTLDISRTCGWWVCFESTIYSRMYSRIASPVVRKYKEHRFRGQLHRIVEEERELLCQDVPLCDHLEIELRVLSLCGTECISDENSPRRDFMERSA